MYTYTIRQINYKPLSAAVIVKELADSLKLVNKKYYVVRESNRLPQSHEYLLQNLTWSSTAYPYGQPLGYFDTAQEAIEHLHKSLQCNTNTHPAHSNNSEIS